MQLNDAGKPHEPDLQHFSRPIFEKDFVDKSLWFQCLETIFEQSPLSNTHKLQA